MDDFGQLRKKFDGSDSFMTGGHQILKTSGATKHAERMTKVPVWATDDREVQRIVLTAFPKLKTDPKQAERAGRWVRIIHLYYRVGMTQNSIAEEIGLSINTVKFLITSIVRVANGKTARGKQRGGKPGRPKKIGLPFRTPNAVILNEG